MPSRLRSGHRLLARLLALTATLTFTPALTALLAPASTLPGVTLAQAGLDTSLRDALEGEIVEHRRRLEARQAEAEAIERELGETAAELRRRLTERDRVGEQLAALRRDRERLRAEVDELELQLANTEERITRTHERLESLKSRVQALLLNLHRQRSGRFARVLAHAESFHDLQVKNHYLTLLNNQHAEVMRELGDARAELELAQRQLSEQLAARGAAEEELRVNQSRLEATERELEAIIADLESTREGQLAQRQSLIEAQARIESTLADLDRQLESEIERLREEQRRLEREAQQAYLEERQRQRLREQAEEVGRRIDNLTQTPTTAPSGFVYPVAGHSVVSRYGEDGNSYLGLRASAANAAVVAVNDGVVRGVAYLGANEAHMVSLAHSERLSTVYTNLRTPLVEVGDRVTKGEVIGYLGGSTLLAPDMLKLWVQVSENGRLVFVDPVTALGF